MQTTEAQKNILEELAGKPGGQATQTEVVPDGPRRYMAQPGYEIVGIPIFPFETDDPEVQAEIEKSRGFKRGKIWLETRTPEEREATESALEKMPVRKLRAIVNSLGHKNVAQYRKYELLDILMKEGFK
jgi:hypothetical protein